MITSYLFMIAAVLVITALVTGSLIFLVICWLVLIPALVLLIVELIRAR